MSSFDPSQAPLVSETLLKKRRSLEELALRRAEQLKTQVKRRRVVRGENVKIVRPEEMVIKARVKEGSKKKYQRKAHQAASRLTMRGAVVPANRVKATTGFIVRVAAAKNAATVIKTQLRGLGLEELYQGKFINLDQETLARLKPLETYVAYGFISQKSVDELIHRRAHIVIDGVKQPLSDNITVENLLGKHDIICLEDLAHEIFTVGSHFSDALEVLAPFQLTQPVGVFDKKVLKTREDIGGFKGEDMDAFLSKLM